MRIDETTRSLKAEDGHTTAWCDLPLDAADYADEIAELGIDSAMALEFLETIWMTMRGFVRMGIDVGVMSGMLDADCEASEPPSDEPESIPATETDQPDRKDDR